MVLVGGDCLRRLYTFRFFLSTASLRIQNADPFVRFIIVVQECGLLMLLRCDTPSPPYILARPLVSLPALPARSCCRSIFDDRNENKIATSTGKRRENCAYSLEMRKRKGNDTKKENDSLVSLGKRSWPQLEEVDKNFKIKKSSEK